MSTPLTLAITGSAAGVWAKAKPVATRRIMLPAAAAKRGRRDAWTDRSMARRRGSDIIGCILRVGCATHRSCGSGAHPRANGGDWQPERLVLGPGEGGL